ncbi:MSMEG_0569 family flavin-dependent oxidoreductase [Leucothrix sargassi]|nr:MSMEG_0569 family flavin-dependent oxidoreductase [Leucothrix sargassi]
MNSKNTHKSVIVIGAGQAGMSMSYCLKEQGIDHLVLEKNKQIANSWRNERWDEFCLVTPNWQCQLPGYPYQGDDPDGFMVKDEIVDYLEGYFDSFKPPVIFDVSVSELSKQSGVFTLKTNIGTYTADQVVLACGSYHKAIIPTSLAQAMPESITHIHSRDYKNASQLPEGEVMVVGTGQSGCQIAEDLHLNGRKVHLCVGDAPRVNRRYRGKDVVAWLEEMGYYKTTIDTHPDGENAPHSTNHYVTGRDGGRDLNLRIFAEQGMSLYGKLTGVDQGVASFDDDLKTNLDNADSSAARIRDSIEKYIQANNIDAPEDDNTHSTYLPDSPLSFDLANSNITSVVWSIGFRMDFDWVKLAVLNDHGIPQQKRGLTDVNGLYFLGLNWMNTWGSGRFFHVGRDAEYLCEQVVAQMAIDDSVIEQKISA